MPPNRSIMRWKLNCSGVCRPPAAFVSIARWTPAFECVSGQPLHRVGSSTMPTRSDAPFGASASW